MAGRRKMGKCVFGTKSQTSNEWQTGEEPRIKIHVFWDRRSKMWNYLKVGTSYFFTFLILSSATVRKSSTAAKILRLVFQFCFYHVAMKMQIVSVIIVVISIKEVRVVLW